MRDKEGFWFQFLPESEKRVRVGTGGVVGQVQEKRDGYHQMPQPKKMGYGQELAAKTETLANVFLKTIIVPGTS